MAAPPSTSTSTSTTSNDSGRKLLRPFLEAKTLLNKPDIMKAFEDQEIKYLDQLSGIDRNQIPFTELQIRTMGEQMAFRELLEEARRVRIQGLLVGMKDGSTTRKRRTTLSGIPPRTSRKVSIGWMHGKNLIQVRGRQGGGTRTTSFNLDAGYDDIIQRACGLFFPNGKSKQHGPLSDMTLGLAKFDESEVHRTMEDGTPFSIKEYQRRTGLSVLRLYLTTKLRTDVPVDSEDEVTFIPHKPDLEPLNETVEILPVADPTSPTSMPVPTNDPSSSHTTASVSMPGPASASSSLPGRTNIPSVMLGLATTSTSMPRHTSTPIRGLGHNTTPILTPVSATASVSESLLCFLDANELPEITIDTEEGYHRNREVAATDLVPACITPVPSPTALDPGRSTYRSYVQDCINHGDIVTDDDEDDCAVTVAIMESIETQRSHEVTLAGILKALAEPIDDTVSSKFNINRGQIWECALRGFRRKSFHPAKRISVHFTDSLGQMEGAVDEGGPRREFLTLLAREIQRSNIFEGNPEERVLGFNASALRRGDYQTVGTMAAVIIVHGGIRLRFFSKTLFSIMAYGYSAPIVLSDIPDYEVRGQIDAILNASSLEELNQAANQASSLTSVAGCFRPLRKLEDKTPLGEDLTKFYLVDRARSAYESFFKGMETLGVLESIQKNPDIWKECFCGPQEPLTAETLQQLFTHQLSEVGSNCYSAECSTIGFWRDLLLDIEEKESRLSCEDILMFATGYREIPVTGFTEQPSITFLHEPEPGELSRSQFPKAQTCSSTLKLPIHQTYEVFKERMEFGVLSAHGFGFA